jgi:hypothetical protein
MNRQLLLILLVGVLFVGCTVRIHAQLTSQRTVMIWDFHPIWVAGRWVVEGRGSPYSEEMTRAIQIQSYGRLAERDEDPHTFAYPPYVLTLILPLIFLSLRWGQAIWLTALLFSVVLSTIVSMKYTGWHPSPPLMVFTLLWALLLHPVGWSLVLGQVSILIFALIIIGLQALRTGRDGWAGICLALATAKPQMSFLIVPALIGWAILHRRYRFIAFFGGTMGILLLVSFIILPGWPRDFIKSIQTYAAQRPFPPPAMMLGNTLFSEQARVLAVLPTTLLLVGTIWVWWRKRDRTPPSTWAVAITLTVTTLIAPRTSKVNQVVLILPLCLIFARLPTGRWKWIIILLMQVLLAAGPWALELILRQLNDAIRRPLQHQVISPILPSLALFALLAQRWWVNRSLGDST